MITKQFYDIGIAVSTDDGLLVPFVRDCDKKNFAEIEQEIANLAVKARDKKLGLDDMVNGSFTITNGGIFGSMMSTPIINGNQAAILGMHSIITRPIAVDKDTIENRPMMYIALSYDHRIIDGKEAVGFLKQSKNSLKTLKIYYLNHNLEPNILKNNDVNRRCFYSICLKYNDNLIYINICKRNQNNTMSLQIYFNINLSLSKKYNFYNR